MTAIDGGGAGGGTSGSAAAGWGPPSTRRPLRILIVEDHEDDAELVVAELVRCGFAVTATRVDTYPALDAALESPHDLAVCDYSLPGMDPFEVVSRLGTRAPDLPVIVISGAVEEEVASALFPLGAIDLLLKDRLSRLGQAVSAALTAKDLRLAARHAVERERRTASLLVGLVDHAPAAICVLSADGSPLVTNAKFLDLKRRGLDERALCLPLAPSAEEQGEIEIDGRIHLWLSFPLGGSTVGQEGATGLILLDITTQKRFERELIAARAELADQAQELRDRNAELMELDRLKTDLVSTVSHELRTPLTSIMGYSELLTEQEVVKPGTAPYPMVEMISRNSRRLLQLIDNLLLLARLDGAAPRPDDTKLKLGSVELADLVESIASVLMPAAAESGVEIVTEVEPGLPPLPGDPQQLDQVLMNLASNAVKFSKPYSEVRIRVVREDDWAVIEVIDKGIGMSGDELARIGTRFFRGESAQLGQVPGTGLGVSVVRSLVQRHGGTVEFRSQLGEGTTATVRLPLRRREH